MNKTLDDDNYKNPLNDKEFGVINSEYYFFNKKN